MNNKIYFSAALLLCFITFSCQEESLVLEENLPVTIYGIEKSDTSQVVTKAEILENNMQWASFIVSEILFSDSDKEYRNDFALILRNENTISLNDLIGDNEIIPGFREKFRTLFISYFYDTYPYSLCENGRPNASEDRPFTLNSIGGPFENYRQYILNDNCVELYFPNPLPFELEFGQDLIITSTAHPLTNDSSNKGYERNACVDVNSVNLVDVDNLYISTNINIIVARPFISPACSYLEYDNNFTNFLAN